MERASSPCDIAPVRLQELRRAWRSIDFESNFQIVDVRVFNQGLLIYQASANDFFCGRSSEARSDARKIKISSSFMSLY